MCLKMDKAAEGRTMNNPNECIRHYFGDILEKCTLLLKPKTVRSYICKNGRFLDNPIGFTHPSCPLDIVHHKINILFPNLPTTDDVNSFRNIQRREWPE